MINTQMVMTKVIDEEKILVEINTKLAVKLIEAQFPQWKALPIYPVANSGNDNRTFHLGEEMMIRMPSGESYAAQVEKELKWLPILKSSLSLPIPTPLGRGKPSDEYPFLWSVNAYVEGETVDHKRVCNLHKFALDLGVFLKELQLIDIADGPRAGQHNFYRGGNLSVYSHEVEKCLDNLKKDLPVDRLREFWKLAIESKWEKKEVWIHGDVATGNLLVKEGVLSGVIDFGIMGVGDPACDYVMAWTFFDRASRDVFFKTLDCDKSTIDCARGWALWKALITYRDKTPNSSKLAKQTLYAILEEFI